LRALILAILASASVAPTGAGVEHAPGARRGAAPHEDRIPVGGATLYALDVGRGQPIVVLHGGPDFDHTYLLPDMDRLSDSFRLIYFDQRGRGRSADSVRAEDVTLASDIADLDKVREHFQLTSTAILGHSWGTVLGLMADTWSLDGYDLLPKLRSLTIPTLVIYGDHDFIPSFAGEHIAEALPAARFVTMKECGHFAYVECPAPVRKEIDGLFRNPAAPARPK
jgi:pimeloyl-ACP methyl ester carboxylesterase